VTADEIKTIVGDAVNSGTLTKINPDPQTSPSVQETNLCEFGAYTCQDNSKCVSITSYTYQCDCVDGYTLSNNLCEKDDNDSAIIAIIAVFAVLIFIGIIAFIVIGCRYHRKHQRHEKITRHSPTAVSNDYSNPAYENKHYDA